VTALQITLIAAIVPALAIVLWPLLGRRGATATTSAGRAPDDRRLELEEKAPSTRALRELDFDHDAGHLRSGLPGPPRRYESGAGALIAELDAPACVRGPRWPRAPTAAVGPLEARVLDPAPGHRGARWRPDLRRDHRRQRRPLHRPDRASRRPAPAACQPVVLPVGPPTARLEPGSRSPEILAGMLQAARQSLFEGATRGDRRLPGGAQARQAQRGRETLGLIVAVGGHRAPRSRPSTRRSRSIAGTPAYLYRGQVLYEQKQDYAGASPHGALPGPGAGRGRDRVTELVKRARNQQHTR
jgi:hypothetical protein